ncbi:hypothetical protein K7X08_027702 [Anisodus acutangulus]|uniref:Uncharacterized protein n=1 Tax=Anisodus acutangulus TaxID=402998 RepID=A0A9Q1R4X5_9SOLA|nr:hypothetical protein K7X08_027702 [Anisodus acutangulus]
MTILISSKHALKAPSRFEKEPWKVFDVEVTLSEDIGVQAPVQKFGIIRSPVEIEKVDVPTPFAEVENVDVPASELEKVVPTPVSEVDEAPSVCSSIAKSSVEKQLMV